MHHVVAICQCWAELPCQKGAASPCALFHSHSLLSLSCSRAAPQRTPPLSPSPRSLTANQAHHPCRRHSIAHVHISAVIHSTFLTHSHRRLSQCKAPQAIVITVVTAATIAAAELELTVAKLPRSCFALCIPYSIVARVGFSSNRWPLAIVGLSRDGSPSHIVVNQSRHHPAHGHASPVPL